MTHVEMTRPEPMRAGGPTHALVSESQVQEWRAKGWRVVEQSQPAPDPQQQDSFVDLDAMTINELRAIARENGVGIARGMGKVQIVEAIKASLES